MQDTTMDERMIAIYSIGRGLTARIIISGESPTTRKSIDKLMTRLQEDKEDLIEANDEPIGVKLEGLEIIPEEHE
jgi:effector-binding domain-containing protein